MKILSKVMSKTMSFNKTRKAVKILHRDIIIAVRKEKSRGYNISNGLDFKKYNIGYVTFYIGNRKDVLKSVF